MQRKPLFDVIRQLLKRGLDQTETARIDSAIDCAQGDENACAAFAPQSASPAGIALIKQFEGCARKRADGMVEAYPDPGTGSDPWTIGWGATGAGIAKGAVWTQGQCDQRLESDLGKYAADVAKVVGGAPTTQAQFDAMVSFHYNTGAIANATLTRKHIIGDFAGAASEFDRWVHAGGNVMRGLVRRRAAEKALYLS